MQIWPGYRKAIKSLASLKLAVVIVLVLGTLAAWGTFVEAQYNDSGAAQRIVYQSIWMYGTMGMLAISLTAVMIDRWPWKTRHAGFVFAHIGILILMLGAVITQKFGVDGSIAIGVGQSSRLVSVGETDFSVYSSLDGERYAKMYDREVDFFSQSPRRSPFTVSLPDAALDVIDYYPYAQRDEKTVSSSSPEDGAAVRFQLQNERVNMTDWIAQPGRGKEAVKDLGPAKVILVPSGSGSVSGFGPVTSVAAGDPSAGADSSAAAAKSGPKSGPKSGLGAANFGNAIVLRVISKTSAAKAIVAASGTKAMPNGLPTMDDAASEIAYEIHTAREPRTIKRGRAHSGDTIQTGWMGIVLRVLKILPHAKSDVTYKPSAVKTELTTSAVKIRFRDQERWVGLNTILKLFTESAVYIVSYGNRRLDLGFDIKLDRFDVGRYQGTMRAASYQSLVEVPDLKSGAAGGKLDKVLISMNEPLKYKGFTFYQASFSEDDKGAPSTSILSVNRDPGRPLKYLGSLLIVFGAIHMFYFKRRAAKSAAQTEARGTGKAVAAKIEETA